MPASEATKEKLKQAKATRGSVPKELLEKMRESNRIQKAILDTLPKFELVGSGGIEAKTIPQIASATQISEHEIFWHVNALRKYNKIHDVKKSGDYFTYAKK